MTSRPRHPKKEGEEILREAEAHGCTVKKGKYFRVLCGQGCHMKSICLTPSSRYTFINDIRNMRNWPCWKKEEPS